MPFEQLPNEPGAVPEGDLDFGLEGGDEGIGQEADGSTGGESATESFYDANKVPEELRASFTEMQGAMTRKSQQMSAKLRAAEARAAAVAEKAETLDQILSEPRFVAYLRQVSSGQAPPDAGESYDTEALAPEIQAQVQRAVQPHKDEIQRMQTRMALEQERSAFVNEHPDWPKWKGAMDVEWGRNQHLSMEEAYGIARFRAATRQANARKAAIEGRGSRGEAVVDREAKTFEDAVEIAAQRLRLDPNRFK